MTSNYDIDARRSAKMASEDRIIVLDVKEGKTPRDASGKTDPRLFTGENSLHAVYDESVGMWTLKYESGAVPQAIKQQYVSFEDALKAVRDYFSKRDIEVIQVKHV